MKSQQLAHGDFSSCAKATHHHGLSFPAYIVDLLAHHARVILPVQRPPMSTIVLVDL